MSVNEASIEYFLLHYPTTKEKAKELYNDYSKSVVGIIHQYSSYDHTEEYEKSEQERQDYKKARHEYADKLSLLLISIL